MRFQQRRGGAPDTGLPRRGGQCGGFGNWTDGRNAAIWVFVPAVPLALIGRLGTWKRGHRTTLVCTLRARASDQTKAAETASCSEGA